MARPVVEAKPRLLDRCPSQADPTRYAWFGGGGTAGAPDDALAAALKNETLAALLGEALKLGAKDRRLLLGIARHIGSPRRGG